MNPRDVAGFVFSQAAFGLALGGVIYFSRREYWSKSRVHTAASFLLGIAISAILQLASRLVL